MALVIIAALLGATLFILFKGFERWRVPLLPAIVVNYITAFLFGLAYSRPWKVHDLSPLWLPATLQGLLFIGLFLLMGRSSQRLGIAPTAVASKMSLALTVMITVLLFHEHPGPWTWVGIALAVIGVTLSGIGKGLRDPSLWWLLPVIFVACAVSDSLLNAIQITSVTALTEAAFPTMIFGSSAFFGSCWIAWRKEFRTLGQRRVWIGGTLMGIVNYASILFVVKALAHGGMSASSVFALLNIGTILFGTAAAMLLFKERPTTLQWIGIVLSVVALIVLLSSLA